RGPAPAITLAPPGSAVRVFRAPQRDPNRSRAGGVRAAPFSPLLSLMADARPRAVLKRQILSLLRNHGDRAFRHKEIAKALGVKDNQRYKLFRDVLEELSEAGLVAKVKGGRYQHRKARPRNVVEGTITVNPGGFGFVTVEGLDEDVFVPQHRLKTALDGDRV